MSAAFFLADAGMRVCLLEGGRLAGGRARSFREKRSGLELDWGPHLFMKANPDLLNFLERIGSVTSIHFPPSLDLMYRIRDGSPSGVRTERLKLPERGGSLFGALSLFRWRGPSLRSRFEIFQGLLRVTSGRENAGTEGETVGQMLDRLGQGEESRRWFWEPFSRAVLNMPLEAGSGALFRKVIEVTFAADPDGSTLGSPNLPMRLLWTDQASNQIKKKGGEVRMMAPVRQVRLKNGNVQGVILSGGEALRASAVIIAIPPPAVLSLLPHYIRRESPWCNFRYLKPGPISSVYLWLDRYPMGPKFEALVGEPWQWLFRGRNGLHSSEDPIVLLAGGVDSIAAAPRREMAESAKETVLRLLPGTVVRRTLVVRERAATWANGADEQMFRPTAKTPIPGLFLAGDWTATGLPATCEGAVRSGRIAAEAILKFG